MLEHIQIEVVTTGNTDLPLGGYKRTSVKDAGRSLVHHFESGGTKGRHIYLSQILPDQQCVFYASHVEGNPAVPREAAYAGVPPLLPRGRPWAQAMIGDRPYPFMYETEEEAMTLVLRIKNGEITDQEVELFNQFRADPRIMYFTDDAAKELHKLALELSEFWITKFKKRSHSRILEAFNKMFEVGETFRWGDLPKMFIKEKLTVGESRVVYSMMHVYKFLHDKLECVDPLTGTFRRID